MSYGAKIRSYLHFALIFDQVRRTTVSDTMNQKKGTKKSEKNSLWSDDETGLLGQVIIDYKSVKAFNGLDIGQKVNTRTLQNDYNHAIRNPKVD